MEALRDGRQPPLPDEDLSKDPGSLLATMGASPDLFRLGLEYVGTITPVQEILRRAGVREAIRAAAHAMSVAPPPPVPGPNRSQLLELAK